LVIDGESYSVAKAFKISDKTRMSRIYIRSASGNTAIVFMKVKVAVSQALANGSTTPLGLVMLGNILEDGSRGSFVVLKG
jgi:hypothetical protein